MTMKIRVINPLWVLIKVINYLFYPKGTWLGSRCSGYGVYPDGRFCYGCSDCKEKREEGLKKAKYKPVRHLFKNKDNFD